MPNIKNILIFLTLSSFLILPCNADVYRYIDKHGRVIFTDKPEHKGYKKLVRTWKGWVEQKKPQNFDWVGHQKRYDTIIRGTQKLTNYHIHYFTPLSLLNHGTTQMLFHKQGR